MVIYNYMIGFECEVIDNFSFFVVRLLLNIENNRKL